MVTRSPKGGQGNPWRGQAVDLHRRLFVERAEKERRLLGQNKARLLAEARREVTAPESAGITTTPRRGLPPPEQIVQRLLPVGRGLDMPAPCTDKVPCSIHRYPVAHICPCGAIISHSQADWDEHRFHKAAKHVLNDDGQMFLFPSRFYEHGDTVEELLNRLLVEGLVGFDESERIRQWKRGEGQGQ